jgi:hypothetical protein
MNLFQIKLVAVLAMVVDHVGRFFFPQYLILNIIGRLAFPLFAWMIANGAHKTRDLNGYLKRLTIFAFISQIPFVLVNRVQNPYFMQSNVLFTFVIALLVIIWVKRVQGDFKKLMVIFVGLFAATVMQVDYGVLGVLSVLSFYDSYGKFGQMVWQQVGIYVVYHLFLAIFMVGFVPLLFVQMFGLLALGIIYIYNTQRGYGAKYLFYLFYPLHFLVIYLIKNI